MNNRKQRRLAVIAATKFVGYSRLMCVDEAGTLGNLRAHRAALMDLLIKTHGGRVVKTIGDGLLRELPTAINATQCAIDVQLSMVELNRDVPKDVHVRCRIGVNLGEAIFDRNGDI